MPEAQADPTTQVAAPRAATALTTRAIQPPMGHSVQRPSVDTDASELMITSDSGLARLLQMRIGATMKKAPRYWSRHRDDWLVDFVHEEGNDLLAGAVSTVTAKVVANSWYVEGPLLLAGLARDQLLYWSAFGRGWKYLISPAVEGFLNRDMGGVMELHRASASDLEGPAMGYSHLDESKCYPTGDPINPLKYRVSRKVQGEPTTGFVKMHRSQLIQLVDMPSGKDSLKGVGYCSVSRAITIALTLQQVAKYKRERLSDLPPAGIFLINNLSDTEWDDLTAKYDARMKNAGNEVWRNVMVAFGVDPAYPLQAELISFSSLPEHYDEKEFTEITIYSFALAFREDPREFWPVSSGPLGTATEAELQTRSARLKGEGIISAGIERQLNKAEALPPEVHFHFDYQDDEQDALVADLHDVKSQTIRRFWEPSPGSASSANGAGTTTDEEGNIIQDPNQAQGPTEPPQGIITTEEARMWAVRENIIPWDVLNQPVEVERLYDTKQWGRYAADSFGPPVRLYRDGRCHVLK